MSQLVLDDVPEDVLEALRRRANDRGVSVAEVVVALLAEGVGRSGGQTDAADVEPASAPSRLAERSGYLVHTGTLAPGAAWPDVASLREARVDELVRRSRASGS